MTIALNKLKSLSFVPVSLGFLFVIVFIEDVSLFNSNTMPVMNLPHSSKKKMKLCGKKETVGELSDLSRGVDQYVENDYVQTGKKNRVKDFFK
jgi:hypothetical protein